MAMPTLPTPTIGTITPTVGGFTTYITNSDGIESYALSTSAGSVSFSSYTGAIVVSGLGNGVSATVTIVASRSGYQNSSYSFTGTSQLGLTAPTLSSAISTNDGFTFSVLNVDTLNTYSASTTKGSVSVSAYAGSYVVTGLLPGQSATVTITASRTGYASSSSSITGTAKSGITPTFSSTSPTDDGFTGVVTNYDPTYTWSGTVTGGGTVELVSSGYSSQIMYIVKGLTAPTYEVVTINVYSGSNLAGSASQTGYTNLLKPTFSTATKITGGFTVKINNYDSRQTYDITVNKGTLSKGTPSGTNYPLTVTGLSLTDVAIITVVVSRTNYGNNTATFSYTNSVKAVKAVKYVKKIK